MCMVSACGGGGGASLADAASVAGGAGTTPVQPVAALSRNIACWGDSLTNLYWSNLQQVFPDRQVFNGGVPGETSTQTRARAVADTEHRDWISVYWYGHNNFTKEAVPGDIAASIAALAPNNKAFIVMSMLNWADDGERGTASYADIMRVNGELAAQYPDNFIDIHGYLVSLYQPDNPQDVQDHNNDLVPSSLRFDRIHLNGAGCDAVAARIKSFIAARQW